MIAYADGAEVLPGDRIELDGIPGVVEALIDSQSERARWGLDDRGVMFATASYGLMFEPVGSATWDAVVLLRRAEA